MEKVIGGVRRERARRAAALRPNGSNTENSRVTPDGGENSFHSPHLLYEEKINLGGNSGKFNSFFIAAGVCSCSRYYQHASRTSNNTILLLMTTTKPTAVNIIHSVPFTASCGGKKT